MKLKEAKRILFEKKLEAIILFYKSPSYRYLIGQKLDYCIIVVTKKDAFLFANPLFKPKFKGFKTIIYHDFVKKLKLLVKKYKIKSVGIDEANTSVRQNNFIKKYFKTLDVSSELDNLREEKLPEEIAKIKMACQITDTVFTCILKNFKQFKSEKEISDFIKIEFIKRGAENAFDSVVASGKNASVAHHEPQDVLNKGFLVLDFGAKYEGYCADMTRTIYLGTPNEQEVLIYEKVLKINRSCIEMAKHGIPAKDIHNHAAKLFGKDVKHFNHAIGHGFGVEIHELPGIYPKSESVLKKNSLITIEPGYYNEKAGIGIRIEDDILLGNKKEILTKSTKNLICMK